MKNLNAVMSVFAFFLVFVLGAASFLFVVDEMHQALVLQFGKFEKKIDKPGIQFRIPLLQSVVMFDKRILDVNLDSYEVIAADQKRFIVDSYVKYRISDPVLFYQTVRTTTGFEARLLSIVESSIRESMGTVSLIQLLNEFRDKVMKQVNASVSTALRAFGVELVDVRIRRTDLPSENSLAVFRRMQTDREKEARELRAEGGAVAQRIRSQADRDAKLMIAEATKKAATISGGGEAEVAAIYSKLIRDGVSQDFFHFYRTVQAYEYVFNAKDLKDGDVKFILSPGFSFADFLFGARSPKMGFMKDAKGK